MRTRKVPGVRSYRAAPDGVAEMMRSAEVGRAVEAAARPIAAAANAEGRATYDTRPQMVRMGADPIRFGYDNELRAGASVYTVENHWKDVQDRRLVQVAEAFGRRSPRE